MTRMRCIIPIRILKLDDGFHLLVNIRVNGKHARLLIDTGASKTVFDKQRVKRFIRNKKIEKHDKLSTGLGTSNMKSHVTVLEKILLGNIEIRNYKTVVLDLSHVNKAYREAKQKPIDGVLGSDLLKKHSAIIDFGKKMMRLSK